MLLVILLLQYASLKFAVNFDDEFDDYEEEDEGPDENEFLHEMVGGNNYIRHDDHKKYKKNVVEIKYNSNYDLLLLNGTVKGVFQDVLDAIMNKTDPNTILTEEKGQKLNLGTPWVDFLVIPAIHVAIGGGSEAHYQIAHILLQAGANPNRYDTTYPPAFLFALGFGTKPNHEMAVTLSTLFQDELLSGKFELTKSIKDWNSLMGYTHDPPVLSWPVLKGNTEGVFAVLKHGTVAIDEGDVYGVTALHTAAWVGYADPLGALLVENADILAVDIKGRTALHYAAIRGHISVMDVIFNEAAGVSAKKLKRLVTKRDSFGLTAMDLAWLSPRHPTVGERLVELVQSVAGNVDEDEEADLSLKRRKDPPPTSHSWSCQELGTGDLDDTQGDGIDVVSMTDLSETLFIQKYVSTQRPVLITGNLTSRWPIWSHLSSREDFVNRYRGLRLKTGIVPYAHELSRGNESRANVPLAEWMREVRKQSEAHKCRSGKEGGCLGAGNEGAWIAYDDSVTQQENADFGDDLGSPFFARICDRHPSNVGLQLSIGGFSSGAPMHAHDNAWNSLLVGRKRWLLVPPGELGPRTQAWSAMSHPLTEWYAVSERRKQGRLYEVTQHPGDVLFIPQGWGHATVHTCEETVAVSNEFCKSVDVTSPPSVGAMMYGAKPGTSIDDEF